MFSSLIFLGYYLNKILEAFYPNQNPIEKLNGFLLFVFVIDLAQRSFFQKLPSVLVKPFLSLPIPKSVLINYLVINSLWQISNVIYLCVIFPFVLDTYIRYYEWWQASLYLTSIIALIIFNHFFILNIRLLALRHFLFRGLPFGVLVLTILSQRSEWGDLRPYSEYFFGLLLQYQGIAVLALIVSAIILLIISAKRLLYSTFYLDLL